MLVGSVLQAVLGGLRFLERFLFKRTDLLITVGGKLRRHFVSAGARHTAVVGNWKRLEEYIRTAQDNFAVREQLGIPRSAIVVVSISQLFVDRKLKNFWTQSIEISETYLINRR